MLGKELLINTVEGKRERIICFDFWLGDENGVPSLFSKISDTRIYIIPLSKIIQYSFRYVWIFNDYPFLPPEKPIA